VKGVENYTHVSAQKGNNMLSHWVVYEWAEIFKNIWMSILSQII
jgi:hypothetical protein